MKDKFVIFYYADSDYLHFFVDASSLVDAEKSANAFALKTGAIIVGVPSHLLKNVSL
nr:MAG TPA: hypothetical protein [Microviridae sp.]